MKAKATFFKWQTAKVKESPHFGLEICDHMLVLHVEHKIRQQLLPMVHQAQILQVVLTEFGQVITERLPARK